MLLNKCMLLLSVLGSKRASVLVPLLNSHQGMLDVGVGFVGCWMLEVRGHLFWFP